MSDPPCWWLHLDFLRTSSFLVAKLPFALPNAHLRSIAMNHFTFVEIPTLNLKKAESFFGNVFEWKFEPMRGVTTMISIRNTGQGLGGLLFKTKVIPKKPGVIVHIQVDNIDEKLKAIEKLKGKTILPKTLIPGQGWYAYFATPDGCTLGLWQSLLRAA